MCCEAGEAVGRCASQQENEGSGDFCGEWKPEGNIDPPETAKEYRAPAGEARKRER